MAFANANYSDIVTTTIQSRSKKLADNVTKNNGLLRAIKRKGNVRNWSGGNLILQEIMFQENGNAQFYSGYETLSIAAQDVLTAFQYTPKQAACAVTMAGIEDLINSGEAQMIDLMEGRVRTAEATMNNLISQGLLSDGTDFAGKSIDGLRQGIVINPATGTVGGVDRAVWPFARNQKFQCTVDGSGAATSANILGYMNNLYARCVRGTDMPDLILMDSSYWSLFVGATQNIQRFTKSEEANVGFTTLQFMNADVILDGGIGGFTPQKTMYMLNTSYIHYRPHSRMNMSPIKPGTRVSVNQDATINLIGWAGNLTYSGYQFHGIMQD